MEQKTTWIFFALLRCAIFGKILTKRETKFCAESTLLDLLKVAEEHDVVHLAVLGLKNNSMLTERNATLEKVLFHAVSRYERLDYERKRICEALENAKIPFLPLKGSVIREYYPEAWMRTSCDVDILVHEEDLLKAVNYLEETLGYTRGAQGRHDIPLRSAAGVNLELHYDLMEAEAANAASQVLKNVWNTAVPKEGKTYWQEMPDDMFYFYHIAHMAKHIQQGGCGVRPFIDLWFLEQKQADTKKRDAILKEGKLLQFAAVARKLSQVWLGNADHDTVTQKLENFVLRGGVYGTFENKITVQQQKRGGKMRYVLSKILIPYDVIKYHYPVLQKHRWLMPFMQVRRWCKLIFCGHAHRTIQEMSYNQKIPKSQAEEVRLFLEEVGL